MAYKPICFCCLIIGALGDYNNSATLGVTAVSTSESLGNKVLHSDVELTAATNQFGAITIARYSRACNCDNKKACNEPPDAKIWDSSNPDFYDRTLEEQTTARVGAMMLLSRGCYSPNKNDGPGDSCPLKYKMMLDAIKRAKQEKVTKIGLFDDNGDNRWGEMQKKGGTTVFDFSDQSQWKKVYENNYKVFYSLIPRQMWYLIDGKPVIAIWTLRKSFYPKGRNHIGAFLAYIKAEFKKTFGVEPHLVPGKGTFDDGSSAKPTDMYCNHNWLSAAEGVEWTVKTTNGIQCGVVRPGYRDKCSIAGCGKSCRENLRNNGAVLAEGLSKNAKSKFVLMEGWNDVRENAGFYRSKAWSGGSSQYINLVRKHADSAPRTLRLQAETADRFHDMTPENLGGEYSQESALDVGRLLGPNGGWFVGWTEPGEWIEFPSTQLGSGVHRFTARCSSDRDGNSIRLGLPTLHSALVPKTGLDHYENVHLGEAKLGGGEHDLRVVFETGGVSIDWLFVRRV